MDAAPPPLSYNVPTMQAPDFPKNFPEAELRRLVDDYRTNCLWFLRPDLYPDGVEQTLRVLGQIERHADREGFRRAARIRQWLRPSSSAPSVAS